MSSRMIRGFRGVVNRGPLLAVASVVALVRLTIPVEAAAQAPATTTPLPTRDVAAYVGHLDVSRTPDADPYYYPSRLRTVLGTAGAGFYWTEHVKTEIEVGRTSEGRTSGSRAVSVPGVPAGYRIYTVNQTITTLLSVSQSYQFFHNAWFHPFVTAGADVGWERVRVQIPEQRYYPPPVFGPTGTAPQTLPSIPIPAGPDEVEHRVTTRLFGGAGFKAYLSQRAFFRTDLRIGAMSEMRAGHFRVGFGVDF